MRVVDRLHAQVTPTRRETVRRRWAKHPFERPRARPQEGPPHSLQANQCSAGGSRRAGLPDTPTVAADTQGPVGRRGEGAGTARVAETFTRGLKALAQYVEHEQRTLIARQHTERITVDGHEHEVRLGVWVSNQMNRRDKLNEQQLAQLAELGMDWV
ncbi:helicase associated domain-containing protein [Streptomyces sp. HUAS TT7]|uniref:helicase associated domain-containing protein n=1 Tax=Streptomyces sp. HUAS TT7 TaxID=3447507 RepID=UPI003F65F4F1